jgi:hypothetical protein
VSESLLAPVVKRFHVSVGISYINGYTPLTIPGDRTRNGPDCWWIDCVIVRSCVRFVRITIGCVGVAKANGLARPGVGATSGEASAVHPGCYTSPPTKPVPCGDRFATGRSLLV